MATARGNIHGQYKYRFASRHVGAIWASLFFVIAISAEFWAGRTQEESIRGAIVFWWTIWICLISLGIWVERRYTRMLQPIALTSIGIEGELRTEEFELFERRKPGFIRWKDVDSVELFFWPDVDAQKMSKKPGFRVRADTRKIVVWEHIHGYRELYRILEEQLAEVGKSVVR